MNYARVWARGHVGTNAPLVRVEVFISKGLPSLSIIGLAETTVRESKDRVRSALLQAGLEFPKYRLVVNLGPADLPKEGGRYDLAIAIGLLGASGQLDTDALVNFEFLGELSLAGELQSVPQVLAASFACAQAKRQLIIPTSNLSEANLCQKAVCFGAAGLKDVVDFFKGKNKLVTATPNLVQIPTYKKDMSQVLGQPHARRALEIAAAGRHHMLMIGSPGSGKTMLAERLVSIAPPLTEQESIEIAKLYSCRGYWQESLWGQRPFRAPHHSASSVALVGGGAKPMPGEISLAQHGVLFLDELPEFERRVLEVLREPLESSLITLSRAAYQITYPAEFQLIAAMNPCPCGYSDDPVKQCTCAPETIKRYRGKLSGPLLDRIDLQVRVPPISHELLLSGQQPEESSAIVQQRVVQAVQRQHARQGCYNSQLKGHSLHTYAQLNQETQAFLIKASENLSLSARGLHRVLRVAMTIADLDRAERTEKVHIAQALSYRL